MIEEIRKEVRGEERKEKQHAKGKLTARERLEILLDDISEFQPIELGVVSPMYKKIAGDGVIAGIGKIHGRTTFVFSQDFTVIGGSFGIKHAEKIARTISLAIKAGAPVVGIYDSGGARIQEGSASLHSLGLIFYENVRASGYIPQIAIMAGPCAGGASYSPALMDFVIATEKSFMYLTGPQVVKTVLGLDITHEALGGGSVHATKSGVAHFLAESDEDAIAIARHLLTYLPSNALEDPPRRKVSDSIERPLEAPAIIPEDQMKAYDVHLLIEDIFDRGSFLELRAGRAQNAVVGFATLGGEVVGVVANNPAHLGGVIDIDASDKIARFVRTADAYNIPIITLVDAPGFMPGPDQEHGGIIRHGAKVIYAYSEASVPKITVIVRKAYGGAYIAMGSKSMGADLLYALPTAEIAVLGAEAAVRIIHRRELASAEDPEEKLKELVKEYREKYLKPQFALSVGIIDEIIKPEDLRKRLYKGIEFLKEKSEAMRIPKKHGIFPVRSFSRIFSTLSMSFFDLSSSPLLRYTLAKPKSILPLSREDAFLEYLIAILKLSSASSRSS